jgi:hypothetical protein
MYGHIPSQFRGEEIQNPTKKRIMKKKSNVNYPTKKELPSANSHISANLHVNERRGSTTSMRSGKLDNSNNNISIHSVPSRFSKGVDYQQKNATSRKVTTNTGKNMNYVNNTLSSSGRRVQSQSLCDTSNHDSDRLGINRPPRHPKSSNNNGIKKSVNDLIIEQKKRSTSAPNSHNDKNSIGYTSRSNNSASLRSTTFGTSYY